MFFHSECPHDFKCHYFFLRRKKPENEGENHHPLLLYSAIKTLNAAFELFSTYIMRGGDLLILRAEPAWFLPPCFWTADSY